MTRRKTSPLSLRGIVGLVAPILSAFAILIGASSAHAFESAAREFIIVDLTTGTVLAEKNPDERMPPSSMSKLMTLYVAFGLLKEGKLKMEDAFTVSEKSWRMQGSKMFLPIGSKVTVAELLRGIIINSGNDACIALAEGIAGDEASFANLLNERAAAIGLTDSHFVNSSGWPDPNHYMTARDLARLAERLIKEFPDYYELFAEKEFTFNNITQGNRNPLLYNFAGADGLKTGHTQDAGYGLTASAMREGRRLILVANGMASMNERADESARLLSYGFTEFQNLKILTAGEVVYELPVWLGESATVPVVASSDVMVTLPRSASNKVEMRIVAAGPALAPVAKAAVLAKLTINVPNLAPIELPLVSAGAVEKVSGFSRMSRVANHLFTGP
ncbi:MAG: D-alanyl-D-alanine carboxypeptidase [Alphaproteobacteria bacterium]|nr:D-alanyl-D-alanine carboxypeptidase [Alphaproteobacteria bacterium]